MISDQDIKRLSKSFYSAMDTVGDMHSDLLDTIKDQQKEIDDLRQELEETLERLRELEAAAKGEA